MSGSDGMSSERRELFKLFETIAGDEDEAEEMAWNLPAKSTKEIYSNLLSALLNEDTDINGQNRELCKHQLNLIFQNKTKSDQSEFIETEDFNKPGPSGMKRFRESLSTESTSLSVTRPGPSKKALVAETERFETEKFEIEKFEISQLPVEMQSMSISDENSKLKLKIPEKVVPFESNSVEPKLVPVTSTLQFDREIGSGAFGTVNAYFDVFSGKRFAVKQIPIQEDVAKEEDINEVLQLYKRESDILSILDSKGLFTECLNVFVSSHVVYTSHVHKDFRGPSFCIQMPLYQMTIDQLALKLRDGPQSNLPLVDVTEEARMRPYGLWFVSVLMQEVFDAVEILHDNGLIHRDLKPGNVLVSFNGSQGMVKVGDFGFARPLAFHNLGDVTHISSSLEAATMNYSSWKQHNSYFMSSHVIGGTPLYRAPNVDEDRKFRQKDDIFSLGLLYLELLLKFARNPKKAEFYTIIEEIKNNEFLASHHVPCLDTEASPVVAQLIEAMASPEPERRPPIREVKKWNLLVSYIASLTRTERPLNHSKGFGRDLFESFLSELLEYQNGPLVEHYKRLYDNSLPTVLDNIRALNLKIDSNIRKGVIKHCRLSSDRKSQLIKLINKVNVFSTESNARLENCNVFDEIDGKMVEVQEIGFVFVFGHYLQELYQTEFWEGAALLEFDFGDLQAIVLDFKVATSFDSLVVNSTEFLLEKWRKVALLGARWTVFDSFLRRLLKSNESLKNEVDFKEFISKLGISKDLLSFINLISCDQQKLTKSDEAWKLLFSSSARGFAGLNTLSHCFEFCKFTQSLYRYFYDNEFSEKNEELANSFYIDNSEQRMDFIESCFFAKAMLHQLKTVFLEDSNQEWLKEVLMTSNEARLQFLKKIRGFFEESSHRIERVRKLLAEIRFCPEKPRREKESRVQRLDLTEKKESEVFELTSVFKAISFCLLGSECLKAVLRLLCLVDFVKNSETSNFLAIHELNYLLLKLILDTKRVFVAEEKIEPDNFDFSSAVLQMIPSLIGKIIVVYDFESKKEPQKVDCCRNATYCLPGISANEENLIVLVRKDESLLATPPNWFQPCSQCGAKQSFLRCVSRSFESSKLYRSPRQITSTK